MHGRNFNMQSAVDIALTVMAVEICNAPEMKRKIICHIDEESAHKPQLNKIVKENELLSFYFRLPKILKEKLMSIICSVGMRMLTWAIHQRSTVELSREYIVKFLNSSFFTQRGIIDSKRAAEKLMKCETLSITQRYKIACNCCFTDYIPVLFGEMSNKDKEKLYSPFAPLSNFYNPQQEIVMFWTYYIMDAMNKLTGEQNVDQYRFEKAVHSGSLAAVQYCLEQTNLSWTDNALVDAAEQAVRNMTLLKLVEDWIIYKNLSLKKKCLWVPGDYYKDILYFAFSKMTEQQQIIFLKKDIEGLNYVNETIEDDKQCRTLEYFLYWPYQNYFMHTARLVWDILPESTYAVLLLKICDKIESNDEYGEQKSYDYIKLLKEFWFQSPQRYKTYVLSNQRVTYGAYSVVCVEMCVKLLRTLICLNNISYEYRKCIELILDTATSKEKENMIHSKEWLNICRSIIREEECKKLDELVLNRLFTEIQIYKFKREFMNLILTKDIFISFVKNDKWEAADLFLKWSNLSDVEKIQLKRKIIYSGQGMRACKYFIFYEGRTESATKFCDWSLSSEENIRQFKNELITSEHILAHFTVLWSECKLENIDKYINWCFSDQANIKGYKKKLVTEYGCDIWENLITREEEEIFNNRTRNLNDENSIWAEFERFLSWGLSSEIEKISFKKVLFKIYGEEFHFDLISANKCEEALNLFKYFDLSEEYIREFKIKTLLSSSGIKRFHKYLHQRDIRFHRGDKWENINLILNWCLPNEEAFIEFKNKYDEKYSFKNSESQGIIIPYNEKLIQNKFKSLIEETISHLRGKVGGTKRKMETIDESPTKKFPRA